MGVMLYLLSLCLELGVWLPTVLRGSQGSPYPAGLEGLCGNRGLTPELRACKTRDYPEDSRPMSILCGPQISFLN